MRKIVLTGTPLQNNIEEYFCMVNVVKPNLLGTRHEFTNRFVNPIMNGQYTNSTVKDFKLMKRRTHVLHNLLNGVFHRAGLSILASILEPKEEYVIYIRLSNVQAKLYKVRKENCWKCSSTHTNSHTWACIQVHFSAKEECSSLICEVRLCVSVSENVDAITKENRT